MSVLVREAGPLVNTAAALAGTLIGMLLRRIPLTLQESVTKAMSLAVIAIGLSLALSHTDPVLLTASAVLGMLIGELTHIQEGFDRAGEWLKRVLHSDESRFGEGAVLATVVWCVGPLAIIGAIDSGLRGQNAILDAKSVLDGVSAIFFASTLGVGVIVGVVALFFYEGGIALIATVAASVLTAAYISAISLVGGVIVLAIGVNMLGLVRIKVANLLPALAVALVITWLKLTLHLSL